MLVHYYYSTTVYAVTLHISQEEEQQKQKVFSSLILPSDAQRVSFTPDHAAVVIELGVP